MKRRKKLKNTRIQMVTYDDLFRNNGGDDPLFGKVIASIVMLCLMVVLIAVFVPDFLHSLCLWLGKLWS